jgi:hypothetical protein
MDLLDSIDPTPGDVHTFFAARSICLYYLGFPIFSEACTWQRPLLANDTIQFEYSIFK